MWKNSLILVVLCQLRPTLILKYTRESVVPALHLEDSAEECLRIRISLLAPKS